MYSTSWSILLYNISMKKICSWCNKRVVIDNDPDYYTCRECLNTPKGGVTNLVKIYDKI